MHRSLIGGAVAALACLGFAAPALADTTVPVTLDFNNVVLDTSISPDAQLVSPSTAPLAIEAQVDPTTGAFTIQPSGYSEPSYSFNSPVPGTISVALKQPATGTIDFQTGAVSMTADLLATITISDGGGSCVKDTGNLTFSTSNEKPYPGENFPAGANGAANGNGAIAAAWSSLAPGTGTGCSLIDPATSGSGGIWISRGISVQDATAHLGLSTKAPKRVASGRTATIKVTVAKTGYPATSAAKVCLAAPKGFSPAKRCVTVKGTSLGQTAATTVTFKVKAPKLKRGAKAKAYALVVSAPGASSKRIRLVVS